LMKRRLSERKSHSGFLSRACINTDSHIPARIQPYSTYTHTPYNHYCFHDLLVLFFPCLVRLFAFILFPNIMSFNWNCQRNMKIRLATRWSRLSSPLSHLPIPHYRLRSLCLQHRSLCHRHHILTSTDNSTFPWELCQIGWSEHDIVETATSRRRCRQEFFRAVCIFVLGSWWIGLGTKAAGAGSTTLLVLGLGF
jgi:hypothetical protein